MRFIIATIFPEAFPGPLGIGLINKGKEKGLWSYEIIDIKKNGISGRVDDEPYGGGGGMIMTAPILAKCIDPWIKEIDLLIFTTPSGNILKQSFFSNFNYKNILIVCGRYEGFDARLIEYYSSLGGFDVMEVSCGDYVLCGGELCSMILMEGIIRNIPGIIKENSLKEESFNSELLESPYYTRPAIWRNLSIPAVLSSGDHEKIKKWKKNKSIERTFLKRPDLL